MIKINQYRMFKSIYKNRNRKLVIRQLKKCKIEMNNNKEDLLFN